MGYRTDLQAWPRGCHNITARCDENVVNWSVQDLTQTYSTRHDCTFASQQRKSKKREHLLEHISWQWFEHDTVSIDLRVIANTLDNRQIAANVQFTTDTPQRSETLMTLSETSGQVTVPRVRVGITVFCIVALPRDRLGITAREVKASPVY